MENLLIPYQAITHFPCTRALVFAPHPDDEVFGCGGAIMRHIEQGIPVTVIIVSDGAYGSGTEKSTDYILQRQHECTAAAKILGYGTPIFWNYPDRNVGYNERFIQAISAAIRDNGADLVYAPSVFEMHPDHRVIGMAVMEAVRRLGNTVQIALYEVGIPLHPNQLLDISDLAERKAAAMACFVSQNAKQRYDLHIAALNRYRTYTLPAQVTAAEAYIRLAAEELLLDPLKLYQSEHSRQKKLGLVLNDCDMPLVSIIIRSMGRATLSDTLDSVALQTYAKIEVIIVNAKGAGHPPIDDWCGNFPQQMIGEEDHPLHRSRAGNVGLKAANGDYVLFLDDDDWLAPNHIAKLNDALTHHPSYLVAYTGIACIDEAKQITTHTFEQPFHHELLMASNFLPIHAVLFSRAIIECGCMMDETLDYYEDWDFWLQLSLLSDFFFTPGISGYYRMHQSSNVHQQKTFSGAAYARIYEKWRNRWPIERLSKLMNIYWQRHITLPMLEQQLANARTELSNTHMQLSNNQAHLMDTQTKLMDMQTKLTHCEAQLTDIQTQFVHSQSQLNLLHTSRSWRITAPLRNINLIIRNLLTRS